MKYPITRPVVQLYRPAATLRVRPRSEGHYVQTCNHVYAEAHGLGLVMDVFAPQEERNGLGIIDVVAGGWYSDRVQLNEHIGLGVFDSFCPRGFTVFALSPGSITKFTGLEMVRHIHEGIRYIEARAADFGIDPDRLGIMGASAGGHLAALAALTQRPPRPKHRDRYRRQTTGVAAAGLFFAPTDLLDYDGKLFDFVAAEGSSYERLLFEDGVKGRPEDEVHARMRALSPARIVPEQAPPPFMLVHGDADQVVPLQQSVRLDRAIRDADGEVTLVVKKGGGHPWPGIRHEIDGMAEWFGGKLAGLV